MNTKQIDAITKAVENETPTKDACKSIGISAATWYKWKNRIKGENRKPTKASKKEDRARILMVSLIKLKLDTDPDFLQAVMETVDWKSLVKS
jgi:transposase